MSWGSKVAERGRPEADKEVEEGKCGEGGAMISFRRGVLCVKYVRWCGGNGKRK